MRAPFWVILLAAVVLSSSVYAIDGSSGVDARTASSWRIIGRGGDIGSGAVAAGSTHRTTRLAIRVRVTGDPKVASVWTVVQCNNGPFVDSRRAQFELRALVVKVLRPPMAGPENCGVTAYATTKAVVLVTPGNTVRGGSVTIELLAQR
jgi:hypothetical protein